MRGAFIRVGDGLEIPNNLTDLGVQELLGRAMRNVLGFASMYVALVDAIYTPDIGVADLDEPTIGTGGYARQLLNRDSTDWPTIGEVGAIPYIESKVFTFPNSGTYSRAVSRLALVDSLAGHTGQVFCLGSVFPAILTITAATPLANRSFKYRLYGR